jgi:hypothetical protein
MNNKINFFRPAAIVSALPNTISNGQTADAVPLMADLNHIVNQVNANAAPLSNTALLDTANTFTAVQSGLSATAAANFPVATQVQNSVFLNLTSTLGTNTITARCAALALSAYTADQMFTFIPPQTNTGAVGITIDSAGSSSIFSNGVSLVGGELKKDVPTIIKRDASKFNIVSGGVAVAGATLAYGEITSPVTVTATTSATADTVVSSGAVTYDGTAVYVDFYAARIQKGTTNISLVLYDGATELGYLGTYSNANDGSPSPIRKLTPSAGSHTYQVKAFVDAGSGTVSAGAGTSGVFMPAFCRVVRA